MNIEVQYYWSKADVYCLQMYRTLLDKQLCRVNNPVNVLTGSEYDYCSGSICTNQCQVIIQHYYDSVMSCIRSACRLSIPMHTKRQYENTVPGWNDNVVDKHQEARGAFLKWVALGRPRQGLSFMLMSKTRATFKLALRYCRQHEDMLGATRMLKVLLIRNKSQFGPI